MVPHGSQLGIAELRSSDRYSDHVGLLVVPTSCVAAAPLRCGVDEPTRLTLDGDSVPVLPVVYCTAEGAGLSRRARRARWSRIAGPDKIKIQNKSGVAGGTMAAWRPRRLANARGRRRRRSATRGAAADVGWRGAERRTLPGAERELYWRRWRRPPRRDRPGMARHHGSSGAAWRRARSQPPPLDAFVFTREACGAGTPRRLHEDETVPNVARW